MIPTLPCSLIMLLFMATLLLPGCSREEPPPVPSAPLTASVAQPVEPSAPPVAPLMPASPAPTVAAENQSQRVAEVSPRAVLLAEPLPLQRVELPAEALAFWRTHVSRRPTLLILSANPMLAPVPPKLGKQIQGLLARGSREELARRGSLQGPDPLLLPVMTVDAALRSGWFSQIVWALPLRDSSGELSGEGFRQQLRDNRMLDEEELRSLKVEKHLLHGAVRGTQLMAAALDKLPPLSGPVVVHIDQSYFQDRYKNEVATPLMPLVYNALYHLRERRLPVLAITFAYGNLEERIALDVRFLGEVLARFIEHPDRAKEPVPPNWQRMADIFHLESLFQTEKMRDLALAMERDDPDSAWVKFALYRAAAAKKAGDYALDYLTEAVKRDHIYAVEYLALAKMAYEKKRPDASLQMLKLASSAFPDNPHIQLQIAQLSSELGDRKTALHLVEQLQQLPWSSVYYPQMPDYLKGFAEFLQKEPPPPAPPATAPAESNQSEQTKPSGSLPMGHPATMPPGHP